MSKKTVFPEHPPAEESSLRPIPTRLIIQIAFIYFFTLFVLVFLIVQFQLPLNLRDPSVDTPNLMLLLVLAYYYLIPFAIAIAVGFVFRPFWWNFCTVIVAIFTVHFFYSLIWEGVRYVSVIDLVEKIEISRKGKVVVNSFQYSVDGQGHLTQRLHGEMKILFSEFSPGDYSLSIFLENVDFPLIQDVISTQEMKLGKEESVFVSFDYDLKKWDRLCQPETCRLYARLRHKGLLSSAHNGLRVFGPWAAFFQSTSWEGTDALTLPKEINIGHERILLNDPLVVLETAEETQFLFFGYISDEGRDGDGDELFEALAVRMLVKSPLEGLIHFQYQIRGIPTQTFQYQTYILKGFNSVEIMIDGNILKSTGLNGPYELTSMILSPRGLDCSPGKCPAPDLQGNLLLGNYVTRSYTPDMFEP